MLRLKSESCWCNILKVTWRLYVCHHGFPVATGPDDLEMEVQTHFLYATFEAIDAWRVLTEI